MQVGTLRELPLSSLRICPEDLSPEFSAKLTTGSSERSYSWQKDGMCGRIQPKTPLFMKASLNVKSIFLSRSFKTCWNNRGQGTSESNTWRWLEGVVTANSCEPDDSPPHTVPAQFWLFAPLSICIFSIISPQDPKCPSCVKNDMVIKCFGFFFFFIFKGNFLCFGFVYLNLASFISFLHCVLKNMSNFRDKSPSLDYRADTRVHTNTHACTDLLLCHGSLSCITSLPFHFANYAVSFATCLLKTLWNGRVLFGSLYEITSIIDMTPNWSRMQKLSWGPGLWEGLGALRRLGACSQE